MTLADLIKEHDWDELIFGGFTCLTCTPDGDTDATAWPCPPLRAAGMTDAHAVAVIENRRLRVELRDKGNDLLAVRGILSPNGYPRRVPMPLGDTVAPAVQWLVDEVERLRADVDKAGNDGYIRGLIKAAQWARSFDQPLPGFDRPTCVQMANGLTAMAESAEKRLRPVDGGERS